MTSCLNGERSPPHPRRQHSEEWRKRNPPGYALSSRHDPAARYEECTLDGDELIAESKGHFDEAEYQRQLTSGAPLVP